MKIRLILLTALICISQLSAQDWGHGSKLYRARNIHDGNQIRVTFHNHGMMGSISGDNSVIYAGEWPIGTGYVQMGNASGYVMSELRLPAGLDSLGNPKFEYVTPVIFCEGWDPKLFSHDNSTGTFYGFEPLPGFLNETQKVKDFQRAIAMSHEPYTWPPYWPDKMTDKNSPGWKAHWDGYFGMDQMNADQESYFVLDDYQYKKKIKELSLPLPIAAEPDRGGLGLRMTMRGFQWANPDAQDCLFWLYKIQNFGELNLDKTAFGCNVGAGMGDKFGNSGNDNSDDAAVFYREKGLAVNYDLDNMGVGGYTPVPWMGFAFLESPGNPYDGIDNDGDAGDIKKPGGGTGKVINELEDFYKVYSVGSPVVLIDYDSPHYTRTLSTMPAQGITFTHDGKTFTMKPNNPLVEIPRNGVDDNLNGLIDENDGTTLADSSKFYLYVKSQFNNVDYLAKNYFTGEGSENLMIDERRDDGIDNDGDWSQQFDDVGLDGKPGTGDQGESDGKATSGVGTELPGEPDIDKTDVDESDQIGLTSFKYYKYSSLTYSNDDQMWNYTYPGYFDNKTTERADYDYVFSTGYFPLRPQQEENFSIAVIYGWNEAELLRRKDVVQTIYNTNYQFAIAPLKPKVRAVAGDHKVTLYWDEGAESSFDRFLRAYDFEGYKIYKTTAPTYADAGTITDGFGSSRMVKPLKIFDKIDGTYGFYPNDKGTGVLFNLGTETGLVHSFEDTDVINGIRYIYAVTSYDQGSISKNLAPTECSKQVNVDAGGNWTFGENVVIVTPQAPSLGYKEAGFDIKPTMMGEGITNGTVGVNIINADSLKDQEEYELQFLDNSMDGIDNDLNGKIDVQDSKEQIPSLTTGFVLRDITNTSVPTDTVWFTEYGKLSSSKGTDSLIVIKDLYGDADGDPRTLTKQLHGMEIVVYNPAPAIIHRPQQGIINGMQWSAKTDSTIYRMQFNTYSRGGFKPGTPYPRQYKIVFYNEIVDTSAKVGLPLATKGTIPVAPVPVNFKVYDRLSGEKLKVAFTDRSLDNTIDKPGFFTAGDNIIFFEKLKNDSTIITYSLVTPGIASNDSAFYAKYGRTLGMGDTLSLYPSMPFTSTAKFHFKVRGQKVDQVQAKDQMSMIKVVPNPYAGTALWEPQNQYSSGRGERLIQFIHLPQRCTIRIYTVDGTLVRQIDHDSQMNDGSEGWNLMSKDNMDVAYGVYVYHVEAPGVGQHVGRILIIK